MKSGCMYFSNYYTNNVDRVTLLLQERVMGEQ